MIHKNTKIVALVALTVFTLSLLCFIGFSYIVSNHKSTLQEQMVRAAEIKGHQDSLAALVRTMKESEEERATLHSYILSDEQVIDLLSLIEHLGDGRGATVKTNTLTVVPMNSSFEELKVTVSAKGSYVAIMHVLGLLETLPYQSSVSSVLLAREEEDGGTRWNGTIEVSVTKFKKI